MATVFYLITLILQLNIEMTVSSNTLRCMFTTVEHTQLTEINSKENTVDME